MIHSEILIGVCSLINLVFACSLSLFLFHYSM